MATAQRILFVDAVSRSPYGLDGAGAEPRGLVPAAVSAICEALARRGRSVALAQKARTAHHVSPNGVEHVPWRPQRSGAAFEADVVVVIGGLEDLEAARRRQPDARLALWALAGVPQGPLPEGVELIAASRTCADVFRVSGIAPHAVVIPLPLAQRARLARRGRPMMNRIAAAPGTAAARDAALEVFARLRRRVPDLELDLLCLEGRAPAPTSDLPDGVRVHEVAGPGEACARLREAFCLLSLEQRPDVVDLHLIACAQAQGAPALAFASRRVREALQNAPDQIVPQGGILAAVETIVSWRLIGPPRPLADLRFDLDRVLAAWSRFFDAPDAYGLGIFERRETGSVLAGRAIPA